MYIKITKSLIDCTFIILYNSFESSVLLSKKRILTFIIINKV